MLKHNIDAEYDSWLLKQAQLLRDRAAPRLCRVRNFQDLDIDNLIEELEALVRGEKSSVEQFAYLIMFHLLLVQYWHEQSEWSRNQRCDPSEVSSDWERAPRDWEAEITGFRLQLNNKLTTNLRNHLDRRLDFLYGKAYQAAVEKTKSSIKGDRCLDEHSLGFVRVRDSAPVACRGRTSVGDAVSPALQEGFRDPGKERTRRGSHRFPLERPYSLEDIIDD